MIKLLIFDLDGTLADTGQDITNALNYALKPFAVKEYSLEETKAMVGSGISKLLESLIPPDPALPAGESRSPKEIATGRFLDYYDNHLIEHTILYPNVEETLTQLSRYKKAVLSNKREKYSSQILRELGIHPYFDLVWGSDSVREKKPSPAPILDLIKKYQVSNKETIMIGDSNYDIEAARAAGIKVIGVTYGFRPREALMGADVLIDRFGDLPGALSGIDTSNEQ